MRSSATILFLAALPLAGSAGAAAAPLRDLDGLTLRAEESGYHLTLVYGDRDLGVYLTTPGLIRTARAVCVKTEVLDLPSELTCDHGRHISLKRTVSGWEATLGGTLVQEARALLSEGQFGPQGPTVYRLVPVNPVDLAFLDEEFPPVSRTGTSSPETNALRGPIGEGRGPSDAAVRATIVRLIAQEGIDPMTVPWPVVRSMRRVLSQGGTADAALRRLDEQARRATERMERRQAAGAAP